MCCFIFSATSTSFTLPMISNDVTEPSENGNISESLDFLDDLPEQPTPNLKRKRSNIEAIDEISKNLGPRPTKIQREQVQVGVVRNLRNQSLLVPETLPLSIDKTLSCDNLTAHKSTKKPNGKGYSKGNYGEEYVFTKKSPKKSKQTTSFTNISLETCGIPDLVEVDDATKLSHPGLLTNIKESVFHDDSVSARARGRGRPRGRGRGRGRMSKIGRSTIGAQTMKTVR